DELAGLRPRLGQLGGQPLGAPRQLRLALAQLPRAPHEIDALRRQARLLEPQRLGVIALERQRGPLALDDRLEVGGRLSPLGGQPLGVTERHPGALALAHDGRLALADRPDLLAEANGLLVQLADLHTHLLATLQESLELTL